MTGLEKIWRDIMRPLRSENAGFYVLGLILFALCLVGFWFFMEAINGPMHGSGGQ